MTREEYIRKNLKWPLTWEVFFMRYLIVLIMIGITISSFVSLIEKDYQESNIILFILGLSLFLFAFIRIQSERHFRRLKLNPNIKFKDIRKKLDSLDLINLQTESEKIEFLDKVCFLSGGVYVTIIKYDDNNILINTRPFGKQPFTINRDRVNYKRIKTLLQ